MKKSQDRYLVVLGNDDSCAELVWENSIGSVKNYIQNVVKEDPYYDVKYIKVYKVLEQQGVVAELRLEKI